MKIKIILGLLVVSMQAYSASSFLINFNIPNNYITAPHFTNLGATPNQVMQYNGTTWIPYSVSSIQNYKGTWNANTNNPDLTIPSTLGDFYIVSNAGTFNSISYAVGDWIISNGSAWQKTLNLQDYVTSFNGAKDVVTLLPADYITFKNSSGKLPSSTFNMLADINIVSPLNGSVLKYDSSTSKWIVGVDNVGSSAYSGTANRAVITDVAGALSTSTTTSSEQAFLSGVTSSIQTQLNTKVSSTLVDSKILVGNSSNIATPVSLSGDFTVANTGIVTIASQAVNTSKILDATILPSNLDFTGTNIGTSGLVIRNLTGGFTPLVCSNVGEIPKWTVTGFTCQAASSGTVSGGTIGKIPKFTSATSVGNSIMSLSSTTLTLAGNLALPATTDTVGQVLLSGVTPFLHAYKGTFLGMTTGNFIHTNPNIAIGMFSLIQISTGTSNISIGRNTAGSLEDGSYNVFIGQSAGSSNVSTTRNVTIGYGAGSLRATGSSNVNIGVNAGNAWTAGENVLIGDQSGGSSSGFGGASDTYIGHQSGYSSAGALNAFFGYQAGYDVTTGGHDVIIGGHKGTGFITSSKNIILADGQGNNRIHVNSSGQVGVGTTTPGYLFQVGNATDGTEARANAWLVLSDERLKKDFVKIPKALEKILSLNGYYYHWKNGPDNSKKMGLKAQEVQKVFPEVVSKGSDGFLSVSYGHLISGVISAFKEFHQQRFGDRKILHEQHIELIALREKNSIMKSYLCKNDPSATFCK